MVVGHSVRSRWALTLRAPRLHLAPTLSHSMLLDGAWWPRSTDPLAELPGLVLALDFAIDGPVAAVMLGGAAWDSEPSRLRLADRVIKLGWYASPTVGLLTATSRHGGRIDLLVVPPGVAETRAAAAIATVGRVIER